MCPIKQQKNMTKERTYIKKRNQIISILKEEFKSRQQVGYTDDDCIMPYDKYFDVEMEDDIAANKADKILKTLGFSKPKKLESLEDGGVYNSY